VQERVVIFDAAMRTNIQLDVLGMTPVTIGAKVAEETRNCLKVASTRSTSTSTDLV